jgi:hypothetical protein
MLLKGEIATLKNFVSFIIAIFIFIGFTACDVSKNEKKEVKINLTTEKLPINFEGDSIEEIYEKLRGKRTPVGKGQYEKTEEYKKRIETEYQSLQSDESIYFIKRGWLLSYDADNEKYYLELFEKYDPSMKIMKTLFPQLANNIMLIHVRYYGAGMHYYIIPLINKEILSDVMIDSDNVKIEIPFPLEKAKHSSLCVLFICKPKSFGPASDYCFVKNYNHKNGSAHFIFAELLELWIYDYRSGEIISKRKPFFVKK